MKIPILALVLIACFASGLEAQPATTQTPATPANVPAPTPYRIVNQDANSRIWQREEYEAGPNGVITQLRHYTELATGLNFKDANGNFRPANEVIEIQPDGTAAATQGQHKIYFPSDISSGRITMVTPEGFQIASEPLELSYFDGTNAVVLGELTNSVGVLVGNNQMIYPNAFSGIKASLRYTYTKSGFSQDVILLQQPLTPEYYGLNAAHARIQMVTEFFNAPTPSVANASLPNQAGIFLTDQTVGFGVMTMGTGRAFLLGKSAAEAGALVAKSWLNLHGRQFLVEEVPVNAIVRGLAALPLTAMNEGSGKASHLASGRVMLPRHKWESKSTARMISKGRTPTTGFVMDYQIINGSLTNYTYQSDATYFISGITYSFGTNTFEGGTVLKFATNGMLQISPGPTGNPQINWQAGTYRPVIFTAEDDNTVGQSFGTGSPTGYYGNPMLALDSISLQNPLNGLRMVYAQTAIGGYGFNGQFNSAQFFNCQNGLNLGGASVLLDNALFANTTTNFIYQGGSSVTAQNVTFCGSALLAATPPEQTDSVLALTNCIVADVPELLSGYLAATNAAFDGFYNSFVIGSNPVTNNSYPFQTVGDGHYYLASGCAFHNAGTTNLDSWLVSALAATTTYPPYAYPSGALSVPTNLSIYAQRDDTGNPDLGYHYDPIDYVFGGSDLYTNVTFSPGTVVGYHHAYGSVSSSGQPYGISLNSGASFNTTGTATSPCWVVDYSDVQEGAGSWSDSGWMGAIMLNGNGSGAIPQINSTFTKWGRPWALTLRDNWDHGEATFVNCEFYAGCFATYDASYLYLTNCLLYRQAIYGFDQDSVPYFTMENCTFYSGFLVLARQSWQAPAFWTIENTSFDGTGFFFDDKLSGSSTATLFDFNAYNTTNLSGLSYSFPYGAPTNFLEVVGPGDQMVTNYNWQTSWFGDFYLPSDSQLIAAGSTNANLLGLYHFTTQTNQIVDGNNIVTIGYHYVATDSNGNPLDTNGDGIPDYLEDANGNGIFDAGDLGDWQISPYGLNGGNQLQVFTPLK